MTTAVAGPWKNVQVRTAFVRVPLHDWAAISIGSKTEFRVTERRIRQEFLRKYPAPAVLYKAGAGEWERKLMVIVSVHEEPLGAISQESLEREGFSDMREFRTYWVNRTQQRFKPFQNVRVYQVRRWMRLDDEELGARLLQHIYQEHLDAR